MTKVTLSALQSKLAKSIPPVPPKECEPYFNTWDKLKQNGDQLISKLEKHLSTLNGDLEEAFPSLIAATEEWFNPKFNVHNDPNYEHITPIIISMYDILLSLKRAYSSKSAMSSAILTRVLFEAKVNLAEISQNPNIFAPQFTQFKDVARSWNEYRTGVIDQPTLISEIQKRPLWYDSDWQTMKNKRDSWRAISRDTVRDMAQRNNLDNEYDTLYKNTSKFVHISPLLSNYYSVNGNGPLSSEQAVFEMSFIGISQYIEAYCLALGIIGLDTDMANGSLNVANVVLGP